MKKSNLNADVLAPENLSFEDALRELDSVVDQLENGRLSLEDSLGLMQRGVALADSCETTLQNAEAILEQLVATEDGELVAKRLQWDDEDETEEASDDDE